MPLLRRLIREWGSERGQGLVEYTLILTLIVIVAIVALAFLGNTVSAELSKIGVAL